MFQSHIQKVQYPFPYAYITFSATPFGTSMHIPPIRTPPSPFRTLPITQVNTHVPIFVHYVSHKRTLILNIIK